MDNDEATLAAIGELEGDPRFAELTRHLRGALKGIRKQSLKDARAWLDRVLALPKDERRAIVRHLLALKMRLPSCDRLFVYPILIELLYPVADAWLAQDGPDVELLCGLGLLKRDVTYFERAFEADPTCQMACHQIIGARLSCVDHQCHHLGEGRFIGEPEDASAALDEVARMLPRLTNPKARTYYEAEAAEYAKLLALYLEWREEKSIPFPAFCAAKGIQPEFPSIVYYDA